MNKLAGELVGKHEGPVLVCGGAPSLPADLDVLRAGGFDTDKAVIVSGNEHACYAGLKPQYIVVNDDVHTVLKQHQEPRIRKIAPYAQLLSRHWWADYRRPKMLKANSGMTALLWGALMGGNPVIAAGFELYRGKECYFHKQWSEMSRSMLREDSFMAAQIKELKAALGDTPLRAVSGPLLQHFWRWDPQEQFRARPMAPLQRKLLEELPGARQLCAVGEDVTWIDALVPKGAVFSVTRAEAQSAATNLGLLDVTGREVDETLVAHHEAARARHLRVQAMIAKVRNHPRSVRRGIYDADLARIIRWTEEGRTPREVELRTGLPKAQVEFLVKTMGVACEPAAAGAPASLRSSLPPAETQP